MPDQSVSSVVIRAATVKDARTLALLRSSLFDELEQAGERDETSPFRDDAEAVFAEAITEGDCFAWLAESSGDAVGSVAMLVFPRLPSPEQRSCYEGYLLNVYTAPGWRGQGIATALVREAVQQARAFGFARLRLHATERGRAVYGALGFLPRADEMELIL